MLKKTCEFCEGIPATVISGIFLILSFILSRLNVNLLIDPAWISVIISGFPILCGAVKKLITCRGVSKISSSLLITAAMIAAVGIGDLFAAGEVAFIMALGEILEDMTTDRAKRGIKELIKLAPTRARRITSGTEEMIAADDVVCGDILRILPGETIPADGVIVSGATSVDQSVMTGESLPVDKTAGDEVYCGTINRFGAIDIRATKVGDDSSLSRLIRMVKEAEENKAPMARTADRAASLLVPAALITALVCGLVTRDIVRAVTVLVVFCPCALVLATPTAIMAAIGQASQRGVIIKSGEALEKMGKVDTVTFDKTGTLTHGKLCVNEIISFNDAYDQNAILKLAASAESKSEHPLGCAITAFAKENNTELYEVENFEMKLGFGVAADVNGAKVICGSEKYVMDCGIESDESDMAYISSIRRNGPVPVVVCVDGIAVGAIMLSDVLRDEAVEAVSELREAHVNTVLLTGDKSESAEYFGSRAGITDIKAELLPQEKVGQILALQQEGRAVCMVGDGVNDAPALKMADVGVAMGKIGSDIAIEAADIALMSDNIVDLAYLKRLSVSTLNTIKLSITLSMCINIAAVVLSVAGLLGPTLGALVHNVGSVAVVMIAAMLYDRKF